MPKKKTRIIIAAYVCALVAALGVFSYVSRRNLKVYRLAARYSAQEAFEETVTAVEHMSGALRKSVYATDGGMSAKICAQVYADALAAESAMSTLPFSTQELEQISGYLNQVGDYAYTLCSSSAEEGFTAEESEKLAELSALADGLSASLKELQADFHSGGIAMDSGELKLRNIGDETADGRLSTELLRCEAEFPRRASMEYDGKYGVTEDEDGGKSLSDAEKLAVAASFAGVSPAEVKLAYDYDGGEEKCYTAGDMLICVGKNGVESMGKSRLISESRVSAEKAEKTAEDFLKTHGYGETEKIAEETGGGTARFKFAAVQDGAVCIDNYIKISVALDDGAVYAFNAESYSPDKCDVNWTIDENEAEKALPESLTLSDARRVIVKSEGKRDRACWELSCENKSGDGVKIYVDAETGKQAEIVV